MNQPIPGRAEGGAIALVVAFVWAVLLVPPAQLRAQGAAHPVQQDLKHVGQDLKREKRLYARLVQESGSLLETMQELDQQVGAAEKELEQTEQRLKDLEKRLAESRIQREQASRSLGKLRQRLGRRLRGLYMQGEVGWLSLVFGAGSISEVLERHDLMKRLAQADQSLALRVSRSRDLLAQTERKIGSQKKDLEEVSQQVRKRQEEANVMRQEQQHALVLVQKKTALRKRAVSELRQARRRLASLVTSIEGKTSSSKGFASWRGRLPAPVKGGRVEVKFGRRVDARFETVTIHKGVDIRAPRKTPVQAVYPGKVAYADVFKGYGRLVILDHGGGYFSLYAHLDSVNAIKGKRVRQGQVLGTLGESGSLKGPYLYFEVRRGGQAVDPADWVRLGR